MQVARQIHLKELFDRDDIQFRKWDGSTHTLFILWTGVNKSLGANLENLAFMMNIDYQIAWLEKELAHAREIQAIMRSRMDAHGSTLEVIRDALKGSADRFGEVEKRFKFAEERLDRIEDMVEKLVRGLLRDDPRGSH